MPVSSPASFSNENGGRALSPAIIYVFSSAKTAGDHNV